MKKLISSIFLVTGTTIGGGMLLLPAVVGIYGYFSALGILVGVWAMNIILAFIFLEANCYLPPGSNLISMSKKLLGNHSAKVIWVLTLMFLYTIMCVYIAGVTEILGVFFHISSSFLSIVPVLIISLPIYFGMNYVTMFNRFVVMTMFLAFFIMIWSVIPVIDMRLPLSEPNYLPILALPIVYAAFGFFTVLPSLRSYLDDDIKKLKIAIIVGSALPLILYILWTSMVMGVIPVLGAGGLQDIVLQTEPITQLKNSLIAHSNNVYIPIVIQIFILFAIIGAFTGISLSLFDFLADGLKITKTPLGKLKLLLFTYLPPLIISFTQSRLFLTALGFAGLIVILLYGVYPILLVWSGRYILKLQTHYRTFANRFIFLILIIFCLFVIGSEFMTLKAHYFK